MRTCSQPSSRKIGQNIAQVVADHAWPDAIGSLTYPALCVQLLPASEKKEDNRHSQCQQQSDNRWLEPTRLEAVSAVRILAAPSQAADPHVIVLLTACEQREIRLT